MNRIKKLEEEKIIKSKSIIIDNKKINLPITIFLSISIQNHTEEWLKNFEKVVNKHDQIIEVHPEVVSHNMETVSRLNRLVRPQAKYKRSLFVINRLKEGGMRTKSGVMLGLGEKHEEIIEVMQDLVDAGCDVLTLGQYLQPTKMHIKVAEFIKPEKFAEYKTIGLEMGFKYVESGPLVRSSYHAERHLA